MPIYAYKCKNCDYQFDVRQRFSDDPLTGCPRCEGQIRRVISSVGLVFKGSGFYVTDNRNGSVKESNGKSKKTDEKTKETKKSSETTSAAAKKESSSKSDANAAS